MTTITTITTNTTVGEIVRAVPACARAFEKLGIDYCCGGKKTLAEACRAKGLDAPTVVGMLSAFDAAPGAGLTNAEAMSVAELCDHIQRTHHDYLRAELPRLDFMTRKVAAVHGEHEPRLREVRRVFEAFSAAMIAHTNEEEATVFPALRHLGTAGRSSAATTRASLRQGLAKLEREHEAAGAVLERFRALTDNYTAPEWACNTFRTLYDGLATLERDMHQNVHKENNVLFPKALAAAGSETTASAPAPLPTA